MARASWVYPSSTATKCSLSRSSSCKEIAFAKGIRFRCMPCPPTCSSLFFFSMTLLTSLLVSASSRSRPDRRADISSLSRFRPPIEAWSSWTAGFEKKSNSVAFLDCQNKIRRLTRHALKPLLLYRLGALAGLLQHLPELLHVPLGHLQVVPPLLQRHLEAGVGAGQALVLLPQPAVLQLGVLRLEVELVDAAEGVALVEVLAGKGEEEEMQVRRRGNLLYL